MKVQETPSLVELFRQMLALGTGDMHDRIAQEMGILVGENNFRDLGGQVLAFGDAPCQYPAACLKIAEQVRQRLSKKTPGWQEGRDLFQLLCPEPPVIPSLPKGLGGAHDDQEMRNVSAFLRLYVDGGDLPQAARDILRAEIDRNEEGLWIFGPEHIASVVFEPNPSASYRSSSNMRVAITTHDRSGGSKRFVYHRDQAV